MTRATVAPETVTIHVPFRVVKRGGRKEMQLPEGAAQPAPDAARALHRRGDPGRQAGAGGDARDATRACPSSMARADELVASKSKSFRAR